MNEQDLVTIGDAARILGVSEVTLRQWADSGKVRVFVTPGGHRRFSRTELKRFMDSHSGAFSLKDLIAELEATGELHREINRTSLATRDWYLNLSPESRLRFASLGRDLLDAIIGYLTAYSERENMIELARKAGRQFGEIMAALKLPLTEVVEAFILHRVPLVNAAAGVMKKHEAYAGRLAETIPLIDRVMDEALLTLVAAYQQFIASSTPRS